MSSRSLGSLVFVLVFGWGAPARAAEPPKLEVVAEMNRLVYEVRSPALRAAWEKSPLFGRVLVQGAKVDAQGQIYLSTARWGGREIPATLSKLVRRNDGLVLQPFPSEELNDPANPRGLKSVLGFEIDRHGVMWILDQGKIAGAPTRPGDEKLVLWDLAAGRELARHEFSPAEADPKCSFLNDLAVDNDRGVAYLADSGIFCDPVRGALLVFDSKARTVRRVLDRTRFTADDPDFFFNVGGRPALKKGPMRTGADGIALSGDKRTLYWTSLTGNALWSLPTALLLDPKVSEAELQSRVRRAATLPSNTDGLTAGRDGTVYLTALTLDGLMAYDPARGAVSRLVHHPEMVWPDTLSWGPDGALYVLSNHLNTWLDGDMDFDRPAVPNFRVWKIPGMGKSYLEK